MDTLWTRCIADFLRAKYAISNSEATLTNYKGVLDQFFSSGVHPERASKHDIEAFINAPTHGKRSRGKPPAPRTRNTRLNVLSSFYTYASTYTIYRDGEMMPLYRFANPCLGIQPSRTSPVYRAFSEAELAKLFSVIPKDTVKGARDRCLLAFYALSARRLSEVANLVYGDVFSGVVTDPDGTKREAWLYRFKNKGGKDDVAEMPTRVRELLDQYLQMSGRRVTIANDDPIFIAVGRWPTSPIDPYTPLSGHAIGQILKRYCRLAGIDEHNRSIHSLRHLSARSRFVSGSDIREIQQALRHASIATTDQYLRILVTPSDPGGRLLEERWKSFLE